jgi:hypothetical protein
MGWPLSHAVAGRRRSLPHSFWPSGNGGARTPIVCVLTPPCAWRSCSHESEVADCSRNASGNGRKLWQREERTDDGQPGRCSLARCRQFPLERLSSERWSQERCVGWSRNVRAEVVGWSLLLLEEGLSGLHTNEKGSRRGVTEGWPNSPPYPMAAPGSNVVKSAS